MTIYHNIKVWSLQSHDHTGVHIAYSMHFGSNTKPWTAANTHRTKFMGKTMG